MKDQKEQKEQKEQLLFMEVIAFMAVISVRGESFLLDRNLLTLRR